ncbi:MAG: secondary thiamine-phosphate synthase enzyme YjbQ, partial [Anaerolineae bacterium]|nr:secondary thiamine-phosphate synthase enzyme YjbQ [Anaerolineae bacterium]
MFAKIDVQTRSKIDLLDITDRIKQAVAETGIADGICFLYCPHTTAGLVLNENWDPNVESDVSMLLGHMVPDDLPYQHGEGNSPAHIKAVLVGTDHFIFVHNNDLQMGQWQGIFLAEFDGP